MKTTASKALAFVLTAVPSWGLYIAATPAAGVSAAEWWLLVGILSEAALIWSVPNVSKPEAWSPPVRRHISSDQGKVDLNGALTLLILVLLVVLLLKAVGYLP